MSNYLIDYHVNGHPNYFDFYLFVNPLGRKCYAFEQEILKVKTLISSKINLNILCIHNESVINDFIQRLGYQPGNLALRNELYTKLYQSALAIKAASFQGKRKGRNFLMAFQKEICAELSRVSEETIYSIAEDCQLDLDLFDEDFHSDFVKELYFKDLRIAKSMGVKRTPTLVIFDSMNERAGFIIDKAFSHEAVLEQLDMMMYHQCHSNMTSTTHNKHPLTLLRNL
ncbi:DsbA family protein [Facklamia languida]